MITWAIAHMMTDGIEMSMFWLFFAIVSDIIIVACFKPVQIHLGGKEGEASEGSEAT